MREKMMARANSQQKLVTEETNGFASEKRSQSVIEGEMGRNYTNILQKFKLTTNV